MCTLYASGIPEHFGIGGRKAMVWDMEAGSVERLELGSASDVGKNRAG